MQALFNKIDKLAPLSTAEKSLLVDKIHQKMIPANFMLSKVGDIEKNVYFIKQGLLNSYCIDNKNNKRIFSFHFPNEFVVNHSSFLKQSESSYCIESLEETHLYYMSFEDRNELIKQIPAFHNFIRVFYERSLTHLVTNIHSKLITTPEERYMYLLENHAELFQKLPLNTIAQYINVQPQSLSRIRRRLGK